MNKLFTIEFDTTLSYWDFNSKQYIPRPDAKALVDYLKSYGVVSLYSNTSLYLADIFLRNFYPDREEYKHNVMLGKVVDNVHPETAIITKHDVLDISAYYKSKSSVEGTDYKSKYSRLQIVPSFLGQLIEGDDELSILLKYMKHKFDYRETFDYHNFEDWTDRVSLLYDDLTIRNEFSKLP